MKVFKYLFNSQIVFRFDINIFNKNNYILPKISYEKPTEPYDSYHHTLGLIFPFVQIIIDIDRESEKDKVALFKHRVEENSDYPFSHELHNV